MFNDSLCHCNLYVVSIEMYYCLKWQKLDFIWVNCLHLYHPISKKNSTYDPNQCTTNPCHQCFHCKKHGPIHKNCDIYQYAGCPVFGPEHITPNCLITKEEADKALKEEWKEVSGKGRLWI